MQSLYILEENHFGLDNRMGPEPDEKFPRILNSQGWESQQWTREREKGVHGKRMRDV